MSDSGTTDPPSLSRGLGPGPRYAGPAQAFQRFYELIEAEGLPFGDADPDEYLNLLRSFLVNPDRHESHVRAIVDAAAAAQMTRTFAPLIPARGLVRRWVRKKTEPVVKRLLEKYAILRAQLLDEVEPCDVAFDILPARRLAAPPEWEAERRLWLLQAKLAVHPTAGYQPDSLSLRLTFAEQAQLVAQFPTSELAERGVHEVQLSNEGQFRVSSSRSANIGGEGGAAPAKVTAGLGTSEQREVTVGATASHKVTYTAKVARVIASAVGDVARWEMLGAADDRPVGGLDFYVTALVPASQASISVATDALVTFSGWGPLRFEYRDTVALARI